MNQTEPLLEARELVKRFGPITAVSGLNLHVHRGDLYGLAGLNGAGKTTTLRMLMGLIAPTSGQLVFAGEATPRVRPRHRARMSALIETPSLFQRLSGIDNVLHLARLSGPVTRAQALDHLARVGLTSHMRRPAGDYSLGMKQRLALAVALASSPEILILDEPTNGLDPEGIRDLRHTLIDLNAQGMTIVVSSHLLSEVERFATHIGVVRGGRMIMEGPLKDVLKDEAVLEIVARPADRARDLLARFGAVALDGGCVTLSIRNGAASEIVRALVEAGIEVDSVAARRSSLEALVVGDREAS
jgi:ABC-type multidrug transport system ATPase subunit